MSEVIYKLENTEKCFLDGYKLRWIFKNLNFVINKGDMISISGESGCGKSTFLSLLGLLDYPTGGRMFFKSKDISKLDEKEKNAFRSQNIGYILQNNYLIEFLNVLDNVMYPLLLKGVDKTKAREEAVEAIEKVGLSDCLQKNIKLLSGGEKQRVSIARAVAIKPEIILADEPTGNLDSKSTDIVYEILKQMNDEGITVVAVTHSSELANRFSRSLLLKNQTLVEI